MAVRAQGLSLLRKALPRLQASRHPMDTIAWVRLKSGKRRAGMVYLRWQPRTHTWDISNIDIYPRYQGQGYFTAILALLRKSSPQAILRVENVINPRLHAWLLRERFQLQLGSSNCFLLMPDQACPKEPAC